MADYTIKVPMLKSYFGTKHTCVVHWISFAHHSSIYTALSGHQLFEHSVIQMVEMTSVRVFCLRCAFY